MFLFLYFPILPQSIERFDMFYFEFYRRRTVLLYETIYNSNILIGKPNFRPEKPNI